MLVGITPTFTYPGQNQYSDIFLFIYLHYDYFTGLCLLSETYCAQQRYPLIQRTWTRSHQVERNRKQRQLILGSSLSKATAQSPQDFSRPEDSQSKE